MSTARERVAVASFMHESNSFTGISSKMHDFAGASGELVRGEEVIRSHTGVNSVPGGFLDGIAAHRLEAVPIVSATACPGGPVEQKVYESIRDELIEGIAAQKGLRGVLLSLHGAMVADEYPDPEGDLLGRLRAKVGRLPIVVVLDLHANVTEEMVRHADAIVGYKTYPHVDMGECGRKAAGILSSIIRKGTRPAAHLVRLPVLLPSMNMRTQEGPMARLEQLAAEVSGREPRSLDVTVYGGFPYADVPAAGASVLAYTDGDPALARTMGVEVAKALWASKDEFFVRVASAEEAVDRALRTEVGPIVLADVADNPASGGVGDTTTLLRLLLERGATDTFVGILHDPETAARAAEVGVGRVGRFRVGGKVNPHHGGPVEVEARVKAVADGEFVHVGPMYQGKRASIGPSALLSIAGLDVAVCEGRASVNDPAMIRMLGVEPTRYRILALKVKGHFRAAFGSLVREVIDVDAPGAARLDVTQFGHTRIARPIYPYDRGVAPSFE